jgi:hypothetical protein
MSLFSQWENKEYTFLIGARFILLSTFSVLRISFDFLFLIHGIMSVCIYSKINLGRLYMFIKGFFYFVCVRVFIRKSFGNNKKLGSVLT